jgi:hypothetical protein
MASLSYEIMQDLIVLRESFYGDDNFGAAGMADIAESHIDGISKRHLPGPEYLDTLTAIFESVKANAEEKEEREAMDKIIALVDSYRQKYVS